MESQQRKPKSYYVDYRNNRSNNRFGPGGGGNKRFRDTPEISIGSKGFLMTSVDEVKSYLEMRNIIEGYHDLIYKVERDETETKEKANELSTEEELERELTQLRVQRPFKQVKTHCRNTVFINIMRDFANIDPVVIVDRFFEDLLEKREIRSTNTYKILPVIDTFRNSASSAKESITNILANSFNESGPRKFFIEFQTRGNYKLDSDDKQKMIETVAQTVSELRPDWSVDRENADYIISLVSLKNVCCIAILKDYFKRHKYNLIEIGKTIEPQDVSDTSSPDKVGADAKNLGE